MWSAGAHFREESVKDCILDRLHDMYVEARFLRSSTVLVLAPSRQGHQERALLAVLCANATSRLVTVEYRQTDVEKDDVGIKPRYRIHGRQAVVLDKCLVAGELEQRRDHVGRVEIVIDDQNP